MEDLEATFIFNTFDEAMDAHKKIFKILRETGSVTYGELYYLVYEVKLKFDHSYSNWGWTNLMDTKVEPYDEILDKWVIKMPKPKLLKEKENK